METSSYAMSVGIFLFGIGTLALFLWYFATDLDRRKRMIGTILTVAVAGFSAWASIPLSKKLPLAIDLQGGSSFVVEIQPATEGRAVTTSQQETAIDILRKRLDPDGGKSLLINPQGLNQLEVQMPGVKDEEMAQVRETIQKVARLEFRLVQPGKFPFTKEAGDQPAFEPGWVEKPIIKKLEEGETEEDLDAQPQQYLFVKNRVQVAGKRVENAGVVFGGQGWEISLSLDDEGGEQMYEITRSATHGSDQLAILIDGEILSHPRINSTLRSNISISGQFDEKEAFDLASALENPLENPLKIVSSSQISPAYGAKTIERGIFAGLTGLGLTMLFMIFFYRVAGLVSLIGLTVNVLFLFGFMCVFNFTLSMPGIAGIVLTIGVAVDANVLIYERLREEMKGGRSLKSAIQAAYEKAFSAIFDANVTTLITATIMFMVASGSIKGFAMTLTVGVLGSLFAALLVTRVCFNWMTGSEKLSKLSMSSMIPDKLYDFLGKRKAAFYISLVAVVSSLLWLGVKNTDALAYDLNPKGGDKISITGAALETNQILESLKDLTVFNDSGVFNTEGNGNKVAFFPPTIQTQTTANGDEEIIVRAEFGTGNAIKGELEKDFGDQFQAETAGIGVEEIGPSMSSTLLKESFLALGLGLLGILIYLTFRFEVTFALGAIVALCHDVIISIGLMTMLGTQVSVMMIGAFLTIAGYSINDTIVVFDRIRETLRTRKGDLKDIMNHAISETLGRTLITSVTTLLTCLCLALFGGPVLREFSIAIIVGILVGTYSSIFVASPLVLWWSQRKDINLRQDILDADQAKIIDHGIEKEVAPREDSKSAPKSP
ncbi:MAG: SecD/SecF fusion protein [Verrucomicrobiales bacterium]|jgi:SecD/SecF fusion protein